MQYFVWGINKPDVHDKRMALVQDHWNFYDQYDDQIIARGPTLKPEGGSERTGSIHIFDLDDADAIHHCVFEEPYAKAGLFETLIIKRFSLGPNGTQFEFEKTPDYSQFFLYCSAKPGSIRDRETIREAHDAYCRTHDSRIICQGDLLTEGGDWDGCVFFVEVPSKAKADAFLSEEPYQAAGLFDSPQVHRWTMGGRRPI